MAWAFGGWGGGWGGWDGFGGPDVESYTVYSSILNMTITRADGARLFEGRARAHSTTDDLTQIVPNLIEAMFTGFPGNSGQDIRITVQPHPKPKSLSDGRHERAPDHHPAPFRLGEDR